MSRSGVEDSVDRARRRRRAGRVMKAVAAVCVATALGLGAFEIHAEGLQQFLYRAPGVGASPGDH